jgi:hypothetical protein
MVTRRVCFMGVSVMYSAIPPSSILYKRLQQEKAFSILVSDLFIYGNGIFRFFEDPLGEVKDILEGVIAAHPDVFGSPDQANQIIADFRAELSRTRQSYPGIEDRRAMIEKSVDAIETCLIQQVTEQRMQNAEEMVEKLLFGNQSLAPHLLTSEDEPLGLISRDLVREGAKLLRLVNPDTLYTGDPRWNGDEWWLDHLKDWRELYLVADELNEEILVGIG